jgi:hypothetical protein
VCGVDDDEYELPDIPKTEAPKRTGLDEEEELSDDDQAKVPGVRSPPPTHLNLCPSTPHREPTSPTTVLLRPTANRKQRNLESLLAAQRFPTCAPRGWPVISATLGTASHGVRGVAGVRAIL